jgi:hypothetical protein
MGRELKDYYKRLFGLAHYHHYAIQDLENLMAYELDLYIDMANEAQEDQAKAADPDAPEVQHWYDPAASPPR